jgi:hypothetical protein
MGTIVITDVTEAAVQAVVTGGTNGENRTLLATQDKLETLDFAGVRFLVDGKVQLDQDGKEIVSSFSFAVDGLVPGGTGYAVLLEPGGGNTVSDILKVTVSPKKRGARMEIDYFDVGVVFTSDGDPGGLDVSGLGLTDEILQKLLAMGPDGGALVEDGTEQDMGARLIDSATGGRLNIGQLVIRAASDAPEPSTLLLLGAGVGALAARRRRNRR